MPYKDKEKAKENKRLYYLKNRETFIIKSRLNYKENRDERVECRKKYIQENKEYIKQYNKSYKAKNKEEIKKQQKEYVINKYRSDTKYKMKMLLRHSFREALKTYTKTGKTKAMKEYGIDLNTILKKLGHPPEDGKKYHIDHIFPIVAFDLNNPEHIKLCFHQDNLQWLEASENLSKQDKYDKELFEEYVNKYTGVINE